MTRGTGEGNGVLHGDALVRFTNAVLDDDPAVLEAARAELVTAVGLESMIDAAAVIASFTVNNRVVDACGLPLDAPMELATRALRSELGTDDFATAANTPKGSWLSGLFAPLFGWLLPRLIRVIGRRTKRSRAGGGTAK